MEGTLERQITIDYVADQFSKTKIRKCKPLIRVLLRMGIYQILYMDQVPDSAACNEAVKLAKKRGFSRLSGFVNGVLRNISRKKDEIQYPSREKNLETYLSVAYSIPEWIIKFFQKTYDNETVEKIIASYLKRENNIMLSDLQGWERSCQKRTGSRRRYSRRWKFDRKCSADLRL